MTRLSRGVSADAGAEASARAAAAASAKRLSWNIHYLPDRTGARAGALGPGGSSPADEVVSRTGGRLLTSTDFAATIGASAYGASPTTYEASELAQPPLARESIEAARHDDQGPQDGRQVGQVAEHRKADQRRPYQNGVGERLQQRGRRQLQRLDQEIMAACAKCRDQSEQCPALGIGGAPVERADHGQRNSADRSGVEQRRERRIGAAHDPGEHLIERPHAGAQQREERHRMHRAEARTQDDQHAERSDADGSPAPDPDLLAEQRHRERGDDQRRYRQDLNDRVLLGQQLAAGVHAGEQQPSGQRASDAATRRESRLALEGERGYGRARWHRLRRAPAPEARTHTRRLASSTSSDGLRIQRVELERALQAAQRIATDRDQSPPARARGLRKGGRQQHVLVERAAHGGDPAGLV